MSDDLATQIKTIAADLFGVPASSIDDRSSPESISGWDSVQHVSLVMTVEERFSVTIEPEEVDRITRIGDVVALVREKMER